VMLMVFAGRATDEILRLHFVRVVVFAGPASNRIIVLQIVTFVVLTGLSRMKFGNHYLQGLSWLLGLAGPATIVILELQIVRLMVFAPATDEILRLHFVRQMVFAGPACDKIVVHLIARFVFLTGPATDEILEPQRLWVVLLVWISRVLNE
ncbi:MAG: hypothetical protein OIF58_11605, partial [Cohaesibacter sp.]|nr:hypothetical protein [Cohaesibacter sp.]